MVQMEVYLFYAIVVILVGGYLLERLLDWLNLKHRSTKLPDELEDVYSAEQYRKQQAYESTNERFYFLTATFSLIVILLMLFFEGFALLDRWLRLLTEHPILLTLFYFATIAVLSDIINIPFAWYKVFSIEARFGFNKTTPGTFISDKLKSWVVGGIIAGGLLSAMLIFFRFAGKDFWIYAWILTGLFMFFMNMFYSRLIVPLFNKQSLLEDGDLKEAIQTFARKADFEVENIYVIDGSKRSTKANAYFTGLGKRKRIVLYDTLIQDLSIPQIIAVLAHEIGHYRHKHTHSALILSLLQIGFTLFLLSLFIELPQFSYVLGAEKPGIHLSLLVFSLLYSPISMVLGIALNGWSRKNEYEADAFAASFGLADDLIGALKALSANNLSNLTPHPWYVWLHFSHPTLLQRIRALKSTSRES